jgi:hypothetical protein
MRLDLLMIAKGRTSGLSRNWICESVRQGRDAGSLLTLQSQGATLHVG